MASLLTLLNGLHSGKKQYLTAASLILLGLGVLTGQVDPDRVKVDVAPITFENVDKKLTEAAETGGSGQQGGTTGTDSIIGLFSLLLGLNSAANRAAIAKSTSAVPQPSE